MKKDKVASLILAALVVPFLVYSVFLYFPFPGSWHIGRAVSVAAGAAFLLRLPIAIWWRALIVVLFVPAMGIVLLAYSMMFIGIVFDDWL